MARLAQVSVRTLRHDDDLGLLKPAHVEPLTGYWHCTPDQVLRLHRILVLRDLGVPLSEVGQLVDDDVTVEQLRGILRLRRAEARTRLAEQSEQHTRVEIRLAQLEEGSMAAYEVIVKRLEPLRVVALSEDLTGLGEIANACSRMYPPTPRWRGTTWPSMACPWPCTRTPATKFNRFGSRRRSRSRAG
ncbi:MAG TPA: MerR family transcriptional regulator [Verrucomicrobiae bacterium]|nr:MerR family transcriptional regulator [Verrucomicrobiae bacterium]